MNPNNSYQHNPFDDLMNEPVNTGNPFAMGPGKNSYAKESSTGYTPKAMDDGKLNDLINPFAVLGMTNPNAPKDSGSKGPKQASLMEVQQQQQQQLQQQQKQGQQREQLQRPSMMPNQPWGQSSFHSTTTSVAPPVTSFSDPFAAFNQPAPQKPKDINNGINIDPFSSFQVPGPTESNGQQKSSFAINTNMNVNNSTNTNATNNGFGADPFGTDPFSGNDTMKNNGNNNSNTNPSNTNNNGFATDFSDFDAFPSGNVVQNNVDEDDDFGITWDSPRSTSKNENDAENNEEEEVIDEEDNDEDNQQGNSHNGISPAKYMKTNRYSDNANNTPPKNDAKLEGYILARISTRTLLVKEWKKTYWVILPEQSRLLLYRSREDYLYSPVGQNVKKSQLLTANIRCSEITCKEYSGYGDLYHFTIEELMDYGPILVAKFSTLELTPLRNFRAAIMNLVIEQRKRLVNLNSQRTRNGSFVHAERTAREGKIPVSKPTNTAQQTRTPSRASATRNESESPKSIHEQKDDKYAKWGTIDNID